MQRDTFDWYYNPQAYPSFSAQKPLSLAFAISWTDSEGLASCAVADILFLLALLGFSFRSVPAPALTAVTVTQAEQALRHRSCAVSRTQVAVSLPITV